MTAPPIYIDYLNGLDIAALGIADRAYLLVEGRERMSGPAAALAADPALAGLYLGTAA